jgi:tryptophan synthase alpha chain
MNRIDALFARARSEQRGLVMPFLTAGYPSLGTLPNLLAALERAGAAAVEIGIPFSDPIADGPVIAASMHEALQAGVTPRKVFSALQANSTSGSLGMIAMVSASIVHRLGVDRFVGEVAEAGMHGLIVPDADLDSAADLSGQCERRQLSCSFLVAPTSGPQRVRTIVGLCRGFVYLLARAGVTGETNRSGSGSDDKAGGREPHTDIARQVDRIRAANATIPIAAGFGIAQPEQVQSILRHVDGAIVGSALVRRIGEATKAGRDPAVEAEQYIRSLVEACGQRSVA